GGYVRYQPLRFPNALNAARPVFPKIVSAFNLNGRLRKLSRFMQLGSLRRAVLFNACDVLPEDLESIDFESRGQFGFRESVLIEAERLYPRDLVRQAMYSDQHTFLCSILDRNDRMTMGASIECRVPFLDYRLVETLGALPSSVVLGGRRNKIVLRRAVGHRLPEDVRRHRKWGFAVPWGNYLRREPALRDVVARLPETEPIEGAPLDRRKLRAVVDAFLAGDESRGALVRQFMMIAMWYRSCFELASQSSGATATAVNA